MFRVDSTKPDRATKKNEIRDGKKRKRREENAQFDDELRGS